MADTEASKAGIELSNLVGAIMNTLRLRLIQMDVRGSVGENLDFVRQAVEQKWRPSASVKYKKGKKGHNKNGKSVFDVLVLPELFTTGYHKKKVLKSLAEPINGETVSTLCNLAKENNIAIGAGSFIESDGGRLFNTSVAIDSKGRLIHTYRKTHLFTVMREEKLLSAGNKIETFHIGKIKAGTLTCYEVRFPEIARKLTIDGARIIFCPAEWTHPKSEILYTLSRARSIENQIYFVLVNRVGRQHGLDFCGGSMVVSPDGAIIYRGSESDEEIIDIEIDLERVKNYRREIPALEERRAELY